MKRAATGCLAVLLVGACARHVAEPTTPLEWHAVRRGCTGAASDDCFWTAIAELRSGRAAAGIARLEATCAAGHGRSCGELAAVYRQGSHGQPTDEAKARAFAQQGCALGSPFGCHEEGIALFRGLGGPKDLARSTTLYERACAQGDADACRDFGLATEQGRRDPPDPARAMAIWRAACPDSPLACRFLAQNLQQTEPDEARRLNELTCERNEEHGCHAVGGALERAGELPRALRYYRSACSSGHVEACTNAARLLLTQDFRAGFPEAERLLLRPDVQRTTIGRARLAMARVERFGRTAEQVAIIEKVCHEEQHPLGCAFLCILSADRASAPECASACRSGYQQLCVVADGGVTSDAGMPSDAGTRSE